MIQNSFLALLVILAISQSVAAPSGNIASPTDDALVNFKGELVYHQSGETRKQLTLKGVSTEVIPDLADGKALKLDLDGVQLTLATKKGFLDNHFVWKATLNVSEPIEGHVECKVKGLAGISYASNKHYSCGEQAKYDCVVESTKLWQMKDTIVATLIVDKLEFEIDGNPSNVQQLKFSTDGLESC